MKGKIRTQQRCVNCGGRFSRIDNEIDKLPLSCPKCKTTPDRLYIDLWDKGKCYKIFSDKSGQPISSYDHAYFLLEKINEEIKAHRFDPSHWIKGEAQRFYVSSLIDQFQETKLKAIAPSYRRNYKVFCTRMREFFPIQDVREIRALDVSAYRTNLEETGILGKTLKNNMDVLKTFLNWCRKQEIIQTVPAVDAVRVRKPKTTYLCQEDQRKIFGECPEGDKPILSFLMLHGCRPGEARALRIKDVNLFNWSLTISSTWSGTELRPFRKGEDAPDVTIPIHTECRAYIMQRVKSATPGAFLFVNPRSESHYTDAALKRVWKGILKRLGIEKLRLYDACRHSFATNLVLAGVPQRKVMGLLGQTTLKTTDRYTHIDVEGVRAEIEHLSLAGEKVVQIKTGSEPEV